MEVVTSNSKEKITDEKLFNSQEYSIIIEGFFHRLNNKGIILKNKEKLKNNIIEIINNTFEGLLTSEFINGVFNELLINRFQYIENLIQNGESQKQIENSIVFNLLYLLKSGAKLLKNIETYTEESFDKVDILDQKYIEFTDKFIALNNYFFPTNEPIRNNLSKILETNPLKIDFNKIIKAFELLKIPNSISIIFLDLIYEYKIYFREMFSNINLISDRVDKKGKIKIGTIFNHNSIITESSINIIQELSLDKTAELTGILLNFPKEFCKENVNIQKIKKCIYYKNQITSLTIKNNLSTFFLEIGFRNNKDFINQTHDFEISNIYFQLLNCLIKKLYEYACGNINIEERTIEKLSKLENFIPIKKLLKILLKKTNINSIESITNSLNLIKNNKIFATQLRVSGLLVNLFTKYETKCSPLMKMQSRNLLWNLLKEKKMNIELLEFIDDVQQLFVNSLEGENIGSILHILENITDSFSIPPIKSINTYLKDFGDNLTQYDFFSIVALFHDIHKSYTPVQYISGLKGIRGKNLTSHQFDSSTFIAKQRKDKESPLYKATLKFFKKRNLDQSKVDDFLTIIEKVINGHAVNTEYIQIDTIKGISNIINYIDSNFKVKEGSNQSFIKLKLLGILNESYIKNTLEAKTIENLYNKIHSKISLDIILEEIKKLLIGKFLETNLGKIIPLESINLNEILFLIDELPKVTKLVEINSLIENNAFNKDNIEILVQEKVSIIENLRHLMNKYLHSSLDDEKEETMRFIFNINDIKGYLNPSSYGFIKLIGLNNIDSLISSPLNSSLAVLAELKNQIKNGKISEEEIKMYNQMYDTGIQNLIEFISIYKTTLGTSTINNNYTGVSIQGKTYLEYLNKVIENYSNYSQDEQLSYKLFFVELFSKMCINLGLQDIYPKSFNNFYYTNICDDINNDNIFCCNNIGQIFINSKIIKKYLKINIENGDLLIENIPFKSFLSNEVVDIDLEFVQKDFAIKAINKYSIILEKIKKAKIGECFIRLLQAFGINEIKTNKQGTFDRNKIKSILDKTINLDEQTSIEIEQQLKKLIDPEFCFDYNVIKRIDLKYMPYYGKDLLIFEKN